MTESILPRLPRSPLTRLSPAHPFVGYPLLVLLTVASGAAVASSPRLSVIPVFVIFAAAVLVDARLRLLVVTFGGLLTLQSSQSFSIVKFAYLLLVAVAALGAIVQPRRVLDAAFRYRLRPCLASSAILGSLTFLASVVAISLGTPLTNVVRDASPYLLLVAAPLFALDAAAHTSNRFIMRVFVTAGVLAASSFAVSWIERRHLASLPINRLLFPSTGLAVATIAYAFAAAQEPSRQKRKWLALGGVLLALLLLTGTRTNLLVFVVPLSMALVVRGGAARVAQLGARLVIVVVLVTVTSKAIGAVGGVDVAQATQRLASVNRILYDQVASQSLNERLQESHIAWTTFRHSPVVGVGVGHTFVWRDPFGRAHSSFAMDTPLVFLAKFGVVGLAALAMLAGAALAFRRRLPATHRGDRAYVALVGYASFWCVSLPLGLPFEDKGFGLAVIALLALIVTGWRNAESRVGR